MEKADEKQPTGMEQLTELMGQQLQINPANTQEGGKIQQPKAPVQGNVNGPQISQTISPFKIIEYSYCSKFPRLDDYANIEKIRSTFEPLSSINTPEMANIDFSDALFIIMKSANEDNIHKGLKYGVWTSSSRNNETLNKIWEEAQSTKKSVYLIFSIVHTQQLCAVGQLVSGFNSGESFKYWQDEYKWLGTFKIKWIYVKTITEDKFSHIKEVVGRQEADAAHKPQDVQGEVVAPKAKCLHELTDCTKIQTSSGIQLMKIFQSHSSEGSIFTKFQELDQREDTIRNTRDKSQHWIQQFDQQQKEFLKNPYNYQPNRVQKQNNQFKKRNYPKKFMNKQTTQNRQPQFYENYNQFYYSQKPNYGQHQFKPYQYFQMPPQFQQPYQQFIQDPNLMGPFINLNFKPNYQNHQFNSNQINLLQQPQLFVQPQPEFKDLLQPNPNGVTTTQIQSPMDLFTTPATNPSQAQPTTAATQKKQDTQVKAQQQLPQPQFQQQEQTRQTHQQQQWPHQHPSSRANRQESDQYLYSGMKVEEKFSVVQVNDKKKRKKKKQQQEPENEDEAQNATKEEPNSSAGQQQEVENLPQNKA